MNFETRLILSILTSLLLKTVRGTILCSKCSNTDGTRKCITSPPPPVPCANMDGSGVIKACSTVYIFSLETDELVLFVRDCANTNKTGCFTDRPGKKTCAELCYTDGCNAASGSTAQTWLWASVALGVALHIANG